MATSIGKLSVILSANTGPFSKNMKSAGGTVERLTKRLSGMTSQVLKMGTALTGVAVGGGLVLATRRSLDAIDATTKFADRLGVTTEKLLGLQHAAELTGVANNQLNLGLQRMTRRVFEASRGSGEAVKALDSLGLSAAALTKLSPDQQFRKIADAMGRVEGQSERVSLAFKLFDSEGVALVNTLALGSRGLDEADASLEKLGGTFSRLDASRVAAANDAVTRLQKAFGRLSDRLAISVAPALEKHADALAKIVPKIGGWIAKNGELVKDLAIVSASILGVNRALKALNVTVLTTQVLSLKSAWAGAGSAMGKFNRVAKRVGPVKSLSLLLGRLVRVLKGVLFTSLRSVVKVLTGLAAKIAFVAATFGTIGAAIVKSITQNKGYMQSVLEVVTALGRLSGLNSVAAWLGELTGLYDASAVKLRELEVATKSASEAVANATRSLNDATGAEKTFAATNKLIGALEERLKLTRELNTLNGRGDGVFVQRFVEQIDMLKESLSTINTDSIDAVAEAFDKAGDAFKRFLERIQGITEATIAEVRSPAEKLDTAFNELAQAREFAGLPQDVFESALGKRLQEQLDAANTTAEIDGIRATVELQDTAGRLRRDGLLGDLLEQVDARTQAVMDEATADIRSFSDRIFESTRSPAEVLGSDIDKLKEALALGDKSGGINQDTFNRGFKASLDLALGTVDVGELEELRSVLDGLFEDATIPSDLFAASVMRISDAIDKARDKAKKPIAVQMQTDIRALEKGTFAALEVSLQNNNRSVEREQQQSTKETADNTAELVEETRRTNDLIEACKPQVVGF